MLQRKASVKSRIVRSIANCPGVDSELWKRAAVEGHSPDVVQNLLALVVVLVQPRPELGGGHHQQREKRLPQRCL
jgi:hypothetical protein